MRSLIKTIFHKIGFICLVYLVFIFIPSLAWSTPVISQFSSPIKQIIDSDMDPTPFIRIKGNYIVWTHYDFGLDNNEIFLYDITSNTQRNVSNQIKDQDHPDVSSNYVIWKDWRNDKNLDDLTDLNDIYSYKISTSTINRVTSNEDTIHDPILMGSQLVWDKYTTNNTNVLYWKDLDAGTTWQQNIPQYGLTNLDFDGQTIVWGVGKNPRTETILGIDFQVFDSDIYAKSINGTAVQLANTNTEKSNLQVFGQYVAWIEDNGANNARGDIHLHKIGEAINTSVVVNPDYLNVDYIYEFTNGKILYSAHFMNINDISSDLWLYDMDSGYNYRLTQGDSWDENAADMDGNNIIWTDGDSGNIYLGIFKDDNQKPNNPLPWGLAGQIKYSDTLAVASGVSVQVFDNTNTMVASTLTDANGNYSVDTPSPTATYKFLVSDNSKKYFNITNVPINYNRVPHSPLIAKNVIPTLQLGSIPVNQDMFTSITANACGSSDQDKGPFPLTFIWTGNNISGSGCQVTLVAPGSGAAGSSAYIIQVSDGMNSASQMFTVNWTKTTNTAPSITAIANQSILAGLTLKFNVEILDREDRPTLTHPTAAELPAGATLTLKSEGQVSNNYRKLYELAWTPTNAQAGSKIITFTASDGTTSSSTNATINVTADTIAPTITISQPTSADTFQLYVPGSLMVGATATDNSGNFKVQWKLNGGNYVDASCGFGCWANVSMQANTVNTITFRAQDGAGNSSTDTLTVNYTPDMVNPTIQITDPTTSAFTQTTESSINLAAKASDNMPGFKVQWKKDNGPYYDATSAFGGYFALNVPLSPPWINSGITDITFKVTDIGGHVATDTITIQRY